ncbi:Hypothetical protein A7982_02928 [Minicystis rosea]|nr:Hypothetical protein A7982_02928 [Minicystis rosea]
MIKLCQRAAALLLAAGALVSCGGAAPVGAEAPKAEMSLASPEAALAALDAAESNLTRALGAPGGGVPIARYAPDQQPAASAVPQAPPPPPPAEPPPQPAAAPPADMPRPSQTTAVREPRSQVKKEDERDRISANAGSPCVTACSALASMERAADHLCSLAGAGDGRCSSARERVKNATQRVHASCPACAR